MTLIIVIVGSFYNLRKTKIFKKIYFLNIMNNYTFYSPKRKFHYKILL
jgi:hypothetical protein